MKHFYVFTYFSDSPIPKYERTFGRLTDAVGWLNGRKGLITVDYVPEDFWY